jgi:adenylosuccinate synthase
MIAYADVLVGLQAGDEGKGKITHATIKQKDYTHVIRFNGGPNAGHTIYHEGRKFVTHQIPAGVFYGIKSIIGPGCVVDVDGLLKEIEALERFGISCDNLIFVDKRAHIIQDTHIEIDKYTNTSIGTTNKGIGPAYSDKHKRTGMRAGDDILLVAGGFIVDLYEELHNDSIECKILYEGAQGFELDIDWGDYPYVTSSPCTVAGAFQSGLVPGRLDEVIGVAKVYETYVGSKQFQDLNDPKLVEIQQAGNEIGATTGRVRQVNYLNLDKLIKAIKLNGVTILVLNKLDILEQVGCFRFIQDGHMFEFADSKSFISAIEYIVKLYVTDVIFSSSPTEV